MSDDKRRPVIVTGPKVRDYAKGAEERAAAARAARPKIGNLAMANEQYKPGKDGPMPIGRITQAAAEVEAAGKAPEGGGLSPQSVQVMKAVAEASQAKRAGMMSAQPTVPEKPKERVMSEKPEEKPVDKKEVRREVDQMDDFDVERLMRSMQEDVINNKAERAHVEDSANNRCSEIDFMKGLANNSFDQWVDIIPGKLKVHYRTITPMENQAIRLWIFKRAAEDERIDRLASEIYGLALVVASVQQINGKAQAEHVKNIGQPTAEFDEEAFALKYASFQQYPNPLIHALGVHGQWFDQRVRGLFTTSALKNG